MFLIDWTQRSYVIYAVIMMILLPSVQLLESPKQSLARRRVGNEPEQTCDKTFQLATSKGHSRCQTSKGEVYLCDYWDCPGKDKPVFKFVDCRPFDETTQQPNQNAQPTTVYPFGYTIMDSFDYLQAVDKAGVYYGCPRDKNKQLLTCNYCAKNDSP
ncbi:hypothetical protein PGT21_003223 [Puccinia graminis f. sp. tritici]|uniref:Uncharacterized protein n=1 Tax=Puccinia graminis f. sp. tritici TaxID=56615 RepID=A0A5B0PMV8_PUCGR|nr:hypothetical protein PGT21_003223 [Puccinia graminis f. sp. tritici]